MPARRDVLPSLSIRALTEWIPDQVGNDIFAVTPTEVGVHNSSFRAGKQHLGEIVNTSLMTLPYAGMTHFFDLVRV